VFPPAHMLQRSWFGIHEEELHRLELESNSASAITTRAKTVITGRP